MDVLCYLCSKGCQIRAVDSEHLIGADCKKGEAFAIEEITAPKRVLTTTVKTIFKEIPVVSVKTDGAIPKSDLFKAMDYINKILVTDYKSAGDVIIKDLLGTGVNVVTTTNMWRSKK